MPLFTKLSAKSSLLNKEKELETKENGGGYFLSLGAGHNQVNLIRAANRLGYKVIAVDRNLRAPGFEEANLHMYCSVLRPKKILRNLENHLHINGELIGVGCRSFGRANYSAALIAKHLALPGLDPKKLNVFQDKRKLKKLMLKLGIPTAHSYVLSKKESETKPSLTRWQNYLPLVARPTVGHGKQGVQLLDRVEDLRRFVNEQKSQGFAENFLLDKYIEGREVNVMGFVNHGRFQLVCITDKHVANYSSQFIELSHHYPTELKPELLEKLCDHIQRICDAASIENSPFVAEFLLCEFDEQMPVCMIECSPEIGGEYLADWLIPAAMNRDYFKDLIRIYTGEKVKFEEGYSEAAAQVSIRFIAQSDGRLKRLEFPPNLVKREDFLFAYYLKKAGDRTSLKRGNLDRLAVFGLRTPIDKPRHYKEIESIIRDTVVEYED